MTRRQAFLEDILNGAGALLMEYHKKRDSISVSDKGDPNNLVTEADVAIQDYIAGALALAFPEDVIVGEEGKRSEMPAQHSGHVWFIDPIDGTQNFVRSLFPLFGISIAWARDGVIEGGGVYMPVSGDLFLAYKGEGATWNGRPMRVSQIASLDVSRTEIDFSHRGHREETLAVGSALIALSGQIRCHCACVVGLCSIAMGAAEAYLHVELSPWDYAAGLLLVQEAGGVVTRLDGSVVNPLDGRPGLVATNGSIHEEVLKTLTLV